MSAHSSFDRASLTDDVESIQTRTSLASLRRRRLTMTTAPQFTARLRPKRCLVGQSVRFSCCVSGLPVPDATWSRADGSVLCSSKRLRISVRTFLSSLYGPHYCLFVVSIPNCFISLFLLFYVHFLFNRLACISVRWLGGWVSIWHFC
jgi:Immunoglobulin I-set domain